MICVEAKPLGDGLVLVARGHANYAPAGRDIVCAGVSALLFGYAAYLESLSPAEGEEDASPHLSVDEGDGYLYLQTRGLGGKDLLGWRVTEAGLSRIRQGYPDCLRIRDDTMGIANGIPAGAPMPEKGRKV